jgi:hypothetical protein
MAEPPVGEERWIGTDKSRQPIARPFGFVTQPLELAARPADDIDIDPLERRTQVPVDVRNWHDSDRPVVIC